MSNKQKQLATIFVLLSTKGGVGKSVISWHILPYLLKGVFTLFELDNNNNTSKSFINSKILDKKVKTLNLDDGAKQLEEIVVSLMLDPDQKIIIDVGGGDDTRVILRLLQENNLIAQTKFIVPYMADFTQLSNLFESIKMLKEHSSNIIIALNNYHSRDDLKFMTGDTDLELEDLPSIFKDIDFVKIQNSPLFGYAIVKFKESIADLAKDAYTMDIDQALKYAKEIFDGDKEKMLSFYRKFKMAIRAKKYLESEDIQNFKKAILS